uniref:NADH-ubiquinone oxidoreductase chain 3 n=1 Tax=Liposcelis nr. bostrychophila AZ TaxID=1643344 RepID=A0A0F6QHE6_9NEOP|nr:NADH dehydrogenase subunit 3 [Liposcelis nr. bostrychophila AZ]
MIIVSLILFFTFFMFGAYVKMMASKSFLNIFNDSPFECGVSSNMSSRKSFSLPFFFFTILFLMFDMEIILILAIIFFEKTPNFMKFYFIMIFILLLSLFLEWSYGSLQWLNV